MGGGARLTEKSKTLVKISTIFTGLGVGYGKIIGLSLKIVDWRNRGLVEIVVNRVANFQKYGVRRKTTIGS